MYEGGSVLSESYILSLRRRTATCGCTDEGPGQACEEGQRLFQQVSLAYVQACGAHPHEDRVWSYYETGCARYYAHLGEMVLSLPMSNFAIKTFLEGGEEQARKGLDEFKLDEIAHSIVIAILQALLDTGFLSSQMRLLTAEDQQCIKQCLDAIVHEQQRAAKWNAELSHRTQERIARGSK